jgi:hypothetical protein
MTNLIKCITKLIIYGLCVQKGGQVMIDADDLSFYTKNRDSPGKQLVNFPWTFSIAVGYSIECGDQTEAVMELEKLSRGPAPWQAR